MIDPLLNRPTAHDHEHRAPAVERDEDRERDKDTDGDQAQFGVRPADGPLAGERRHNDQECE